MNSGPISYEVIDGPSFIQSSLHTLLSVNYFDIPLLIYFALISVFVYSLFRYRNSTFFLTLQFFVSITFVCFTENVNAYFNERWQEFMFSNNYFDVECIFIFLMWTIPFSIIAVAITIGFFFDLCKSIAVHRFFNTILPNNNEPPKAKSN